MRLRKLNIYAFVMVLFGSMAVLVHAQQFDQNYLKWKAQQEAIDQKLGKNDPHYYLSKPMTQRSTPKNAQSATASHEKINLNTANAQALQGLEGVGEKKALAIIDYRQQHGGFKSIDELKEVKGIGDKLLQKNRSKLKI